MEIRGLININMKEQKKFLPKFIFLCCYCFLLLLLIYAILQKEYSVLAYNAPKELREMNTVAFAHCFADMDNPYSASALKDGIPVVTSIYGLLVPLFMSPFIRLLSFTHLHTLQICEFLTLAVELIGTICFYRLIIRKTGNHLLSLIGAFLFQTCYWRYSSFGGAFPDQWGLTLSVVFMDLLYADEQKKRYHPLVYAGCMIALFYIKQYFVLIIIGLCVYLCIYSVKDLKKLIIYGIFLGCLSTVLVYFLFPLYFSEVFPIAHGQALTGDSLYSLTQIIKLSLYYAPIVLFVVVGIFINAYNMIRMKQIRGKITYELCQIIFILLPVFHLAENQGTNYTYYLQLWCPYIILYGIVFAADILKYLQHKNQNPIYINVPKAFFPVICSISIWLLLTLSVIKVLPSYRYSPMTKEQQEAWNRAYSLLDEYSSDGEILVSMLLSDYCLEHGIATSNYGQAEYNNIQNLENYKNNKLWRNIFLFDYTEELLQKNISYNQSVKEKLYNQSYRCVALVYAGEYHLTDDDLINAGYIPAASEELISGDQCWYTVFYTVTDR